MMGKLLKVNTLCDYVDSFSSGKHSIFSPYHFPFKTLSKILIEFFTECQTRTAVIVNFLQNKMN